MATQESRPPPPNFPPGLWGSILASVSLSTPNIEPKEIETLKEKAKEMLLISTEDLLQNIELINLLCRLGLSYHFESEIDEQLSYIFSNLNLDDLSDDFDSGSDLHNMATLFQILRQHGYNVSCDVFKKFKDCDGNFKKTITNDSRGILSLYEATFVGMHGEEDILDKARSFARPLLESLATESDSHLAQYIKNALRVPFHRGLPRLEARKYICFYQHQENHNETLLKFAKLDFNRVQLMYRQEIAFLLRWWEDLNLEKDCHYARWDRIVEGYLLGVGAHFEPQFSLSRIFLGKFIQLVSLLDDTYDSYGTLEELKCLTNAFERFTMDASDEIPSEHTNIIYKEYINFFEDMEKDAIKKGRCYIVHHTKEKFKELVRSYHLEAQWYHGGYLPSFNEYMKNALISSSFDVLTPIAFIGMETIAGVEEYKWLETNPKIVQASKVSARLLNDMVARKDELKKGHCLSWDCYMKEHGVSKEKAIEEMKKMVEDAWKDMNEEIMKPNSIAMPLLMTSLNLGRVMDVVYTDCRDGFTYSLNSEDVVNQLFFEQLPH
ncbi:probable terpene synthase 6 [Mercurialis annua]|uniref:probable terpene synthase 6 n=1 Tax=Mercurialis annua TaxID=3986 RepID=UPI00215F2A0B|nr:probable terpene synthase 6 [Mercurialis annua]